LQQVQPSNKGYRFQASALLGWSNLPLLCQIKQPTLVLHGIDDPLIPLVNAQLTAKAITNSQIEVLDCGHLFALTRTKQMIGMIERFVESD